MLGIIFLLPEIYFFSTLLIILFLNLNFSKNLNNNFYPILLRVNAFLIIQTIIYLIILYFNLVSYNFALFNYNFISSGFIVFVKILLLILFLFVVIYFYYYLFSKKIFNFEFFYLISLAIFTFLLVLNSNGLLLLFITLELYNLIMYSLIGLRKNSNYSNEAAIKYLIYSSLVTGIFLFSISIIYSTTGCINFFDLELFLWASSYEQSGFLVNAGFYLLIFSLLMKLGIAPFHFWIVDVYDGAPLPITFFLSFIPKIVYFSIFLRLIAIIFKNLYFFWIWFFLFFVCVSLLVGVVGALYQIKIKRIIIFSTVANSSFFLIPFFFEDIYNIVFLFYFILIYSLNLIGIFLLLLFLQNFSSYINFKSFVNLKNLFYLNPLYTICFSIFIFSIAGLPPLAGFFPKFYLILNLFIFDWFYVGIYVILFSSISYFYYVRVIKLFFFFSKKKFIFLTPISFSASLIVSNLVLFNIFFLIFAGDFIYILFYLLLN